MKVNEALNAMCPGEIIRVSATDMGFARDVASWCSRTGNTFLGTEKQGLEHIVSIQKGAAGAGLAAGCRSGAGTAELPQGKTLIVFDGAKTGSSWLRPSCSLTSSLALTSAPKPTTDRKSVV